MANLIQKDANKIAALILSHIRGTITEEEKETLNQWINASDKNQKVFTDCTSPSFFDKAITKAYPGAKQYENTWNVIRLKTIAAQRKRRLYTSLKVAAGILIVVSLGIIYHFIDRPAVQQLASYDFSPGKSIAILELDDGQQVILGKDSTFSFMSSTGSEIVNQGNSLNYTSVKAEKEVYNRLLTPRGGEYGITLSDGTRIYLNAESELKYPETFTGKERKVYLKGEAYFEVEHSDKKPFIVDVAGVQTRVMGTSFNIRSYPGEEQMATTLVSGKVNIISQENSAILRPGQQAVVKNMQANIDVKEVDTKDYTAWHFGRLIYDDEPLHKILTELARWYDFDIVFEDQDAKQIPFSCNLKRYENLSELLDIMGRTRKVQFIVAEKSVTVMKYEEKAISR